VQFLSQICKLFFHSVCVCVCVFTLTFRRRRYAGYRNSTYPSVSIYSVLLHADDSVVKSVRVLDCSILKLGRRRLTYDVT
jgi:hypothetical protein